MGLDRRLGVDTQATTAALPASGVIDCGRWTTSRSVRPTDVPSSRPTSVPDFDLALLAGVGGVERDARGPVALAEAMVPVRDGSTPPPAMSLRATFLLLHVDGVSTLAQIAASSGLPLEEVLGCFVDLVEIGAVVVGGAARSPAAPASSVFPHKRSA